MKVDQVVTINVRVQDTPPGLDVQGAGVALSAPTGAVNIVDGAETVIAAVPPPAGGHGPLHDHVARRRASVNGALSR